MKIWNAFKNVIIKDKKNRVKKAKKAGQLQARVAAVRACEGLRKNERMIITSNGNVSPYGACYELYPNYDPKKHDYKTTEEVQAYYSGFRKELKRQVPIKPKGTYGKYVLERTW